MDAVKLKEVSRLEIYGGKLKGYVKVARIDHWFKNVFMLFGVLIAIFHNPSAIKLSHIPILVLAILATCLTASSNYVLNEIQDAKFDRIHPKKKFPS